MAPVYLVLGAARLPILGGLIEERGQRLLRRRVVPRARESRARHKPRRRIYCLRCFATVESRTPKCALGGHLRRPAEHRIYWNRHPSLQASERLAKTMAVFGTTAGGCALLPFGIGTGRGGSCSGPPSPAWRGG